MTDKDDVAEGAEQRSGENLDEDVRELVLGGYVAKNHSFGGDLVTQLPHAHSKVAVAGGDDGVAGHAHAGLVVLVKDDSGWCGAKNLGDHTGQQESRFGGLDHDKVFRLSGAETND